MYTLNKKHLTCLKFVFQVVCVQTVSDKDRLAVSLLSFCQDVQFLQFLHYFTNIFFFTFFKN